MSDTPSCAASIALGQVMVGALMAILLTRRIRVQGFIVFEDHAAKFDAFLESMHNWVHAGKVRVREDLVTGMENAPQALMGQREGRIFGKLLIGVAAN